jgi:hypothetical protein
MLPNLANSSREWLLVWLHHKIEKKEKKRKEKQTWVGVVIFQNFNCCVIG